MYKIILLDCVVPIIETHVGNNQTVHCTNTYPPLKKEEKNTLTHHVSSRSTR